MNATPTPAHLLEHQSRYWTGLSPTPRRPDDAQFKPCTLSEVRQCLDPAKFNAAADLVDKIPENKSSAVENFKAISAAITMSEMREADSLFYAILERGEGDKLFFFAWRPDR